MSGLETVALEHRTYGEESSGPPLVVLHGLFGSSRNWDRVAKRLAEHGRVYVLDLRNHGRSPHHEDASYEAMTADVLRWLDEQGIERCVLMGHSLGGKVAMSLACEEPATVERLFVLDIAPRSTEIDTTLIDALLALDLEKLESRRDAEQQLAATIADRAVRLFLLTNLERTDEGGFRWQIPLDILRAELPEIHAAPLEPEDRYEGPTLFIAGGDSHYVSVGDYEEAKTHFPNAELVVLDGVGHNVHVEGGEAFLEAVGEWSE